MFNKKLLERKVQALENDRQLLERKVQALENDRPWYYNKIDNLERELRALGDYLGVEIKEGKRVVKVPNDLGDFCKTPKNLNEIVQFMWDQRKPLEAAAPATLSSEYKAGQDAARLQIKTRLLKEALESDAQDAALICRLANITCGFPDVA